MNFIFLLLTLPLLYWPGGLETAPRLRQVGIETIAVPPARAAAWREAGFKVTAITLSELDGRVRLLTPQMLQKINVASPTRAPWIDANGWRFTRKPAGQFLYDLPLNKAALSAAEAFAYNADVILKIDSGDLEDLGAMIGFLRGLPSDQLPQVADLVVIDDGSVATGEVMNLLSRRNLLYVMGAGPSPLYEMNLKIGTREYPLNEASDPDTFVQRLRRQVGDDKRALRIFGSEVVIGKLYSDGSRVRLHLLNYGGREVEGLRIRILGKYDRGEAAIWGMPLQRIEDLSNASGSTEFTISKLGKYGFVELVKGK